MTDATPRRGVARVLYSPKQRFQTVVFAPGECKRVGRDERAEVRIADPELRGVHFELLFDGEWFHVWEKSGSGGLAIGGQPAPYGEITDDGGFVVAGETTLLLDIEARGAVAPEGAAAKALTTLGPLRDHGVLYALVDAARDPRVLTVLRRSVDTHESLYEGAAGAAFDDVAPYLVKLMPDSRLLERLLSEGWGEAWGVFLVSGEPFREVRRHLRRFLMVHELPTMRRLYFRFYDPRVLRDFLPIASRRQRGELFGQFTRESNPVEAGASVIDALLWESETADLVRENAVGERRALVSHS